MAVSLIRTLYYHRCEHVEWLLIFRLVEIAIYLGDDMFTILEVKHRFTIIINLKKAFRIYDVWSGGGPLW